jgi:hypothetical protein
MKQLPEEDSEDLTDEQVAQAVETKGQADLTVRLVHLSCSTCGALHEAVDHALRRRAPHLYSRTKAKCPAGHDEVFVYCVDWLKGTAR